MQTVGTSSLTGLTLSSGSTYTTGERRQFGPERRDRQQRDVRHQWRDGRRDRQYHQRRDAVGGRRRYHSRPREQQRRLPARQQRHADEQRTTQSRARAKSATAACWRSTIRRPSTRTCQGRRSKVNVASGGVTNTGTLEATGGGDTATSTTAITNTGGAITAGSGDGAQPSTSTTSRSPVGNADYDRRRRYADRR